MLDKVHARQSEKKNIVDCSKSEADWNIWLQSMHDKTVTLLIYDYEVGIGRKQDHQVFIKDCIRPAETDRAGAVAEVSLREIVGRLQDVWGATYDGEAVVWRMWANEATRNLDRSTWDDAVLAQPPPRILRLLRASNSRLQKHLNHLNHSTSIALDCVNASIGTNGVIDYYDTAGTFDRVEFVKSCQDFAYSKRAAVGPYPRANSV
ncbi:hypothetical protein F441_11018 [Phytophthora nicotianae CJ01A1]|uniref:Uncharacterized protein n=3 Tax=Phytophthora nicotianae TaxID=4792 RepID=W2L079_PHYNI|nr:hypothetical protein L915_10826 [Phytophthora nicotianae]ETL37621.1 hypothetical protein L916_10719 [Phytophthora nicotianae]ETL90767.1 hypothetical protein L917_10623 [Phytophthora nicotianae]ETO72824.1 hypothetical protein F444_11180 [Phytophthora nicotianae P1976]ETP13999.1 hypothetical protein F441_11018 [Phytophthora nicotianae CJ01A1]